MFCFGYLSILPISLCTGVIKVMASSAAWWVRDFEESPTPKYGIMHMKLAGAIAIVFLINHDFQSHVYVVNGNYWHL